MKRSKTDYRGGNALKFSTRALELVVTTDVGPRVASLRSLAGKAGNLFLEMPADDSATTDSTCGADTGSGIRPRTSSAATNLMMIRWR